MTREFFIEINIPDIVATFENGGRLIKGPFLWIYERDGKSSIAKEPDVAVKGAEGDGIGIFVWKGGENL